MKGTAAVALAIAAVISTAGLAQGHFSGHDSVIGSAGNRRLPWSSATDYDSAKSHARSTWNAVGDVDIHQISGSESATLRWLDVNDSSTGFAAWYHYEPSALDYIYMNAYYLGLPGDAGVGYNADQEKAVAAHEVGHALGLAHNSDYTQLMHSNPAAYDGSFHIVPQTHDKADYHALWGAWAYDVSDDRLLVGGATDVFIGTVDRQAGEVDVPVVGALPGEAPSRVAWQVTTESAIKGDPGHHVTVIQQAGYDQEGNVMLFEGDSLLVPGETYLFVTHGGDGDYTLMAPGFDHYRVKGDASLRSLTERFEAAEASQVDPWSVIDG